MNICNDIDLAVGQSLLALSLADLTQYKRSKNRRGKLESRNMSSRFYNLMLLLAYSELGEFFHQAGLLLAKEVL